MWLAFGAKNWRLEQSKRRNRLPSTCCLGACSGFFGQHKVPQKMQLKASEMQL